MKLAEFRIAIFHQEFHIDPARVHLQDLLAPSSYPEMSSPRAFEKSRLSQVDVCPGDAVVEAGLSSAGEHLPSIGFGYIEMAGECIFCLSLAMLTPIGCEFEQWQHEALIIRNCHYLTSRFVLLLRFFDNPVEPKKIVPCSQKSYGIPSSTNITFSKFLTNQSLDSV